MNEDELTQYALELRRLLLDHQSDYRGSLWRAPPLSKFSNLRLVGEGTRSPSLTLDVPEGTLRIVVVD